MSMANLSAAGAVGLLGLTVSLFAACGGESTSSRAEGNAGGAQGLAGSSNAGASSPAAGAGSAGAPNTAEVMGTGPLDTAGLPTAFPPLVCDGPLGSLQLALPCKVGQGGVSFVECYDVSGRTAFAFMLTLQSAAASLGQPVPIMSYPNYAKLEVGGTHYSGTLRGTLVFSQVDAQGRGFVAQLEDAHILWTSAGQPDVDCELATTPLWATGGDFI